MKITWRISELFIALWGIVIFDKVQKSLSDDYCNDEGVQIKLNKDEVEDANYIKIDIPSTVDYRNFGIFQRC